VSDYQYEGTELDLFVAAHRWKRYLAKHIRPWLGPRVLEVGAGIGTTTAALAVGRHDYWLCLEPDQSLAARLEARLDSRSLPEFCRVAVGSTATIGQRGAGEAEQAGLGFDAILYVDVLEHIEDDRAELLRAAELLRGGGRIIVLSPAHQWLYSPFDRALGHCRRYTRSTLARVAPASLRRRRLIYLDSAGLFASAANRLFLRQSMPSARQVALWNDVLIPASMVLDPLTLFGVGKSVLGVWSRDQQE
jgi:SAM-dependent methyltransferase